MISAHLELPDDVDALKAVVIAMAGRGDQAEAEIDALNSTNARFDERNGRRSRSSGCWSGPAMANESVQGADDDQYVRALEKIEAGVAAIKAEIAKPGPPGRREYRGHARPLHRIWSGFEVVLEPEDLPGNEGHERVLIGEDVSERVDATPAGFGVIVTRPAAMPIATARAGSPKHRPTTALSGPASPPPRCWPKRPQSQLKLKQEGTGQIWAREPLTPLGIRSRHI